jgi:putative ABC transport system permease protein
MQEVALLAAAPGVLAASPEASLSGRVVGDDGERGANTTIAAVGADWAFVRGRRVAPGGRFLSRLDEAERRRTAVVGALLAEQLFGRADVVGRTLRVFEQPFTIVGVLPREPQLMNYSGDDERKVLVPYATAQTLRGLRTAGYVLTRIDDADQGRTRQAEQRALLAGSLRFDARDPAAVRIVNHAVTAGEIRGIVQGTRVFLFVVGMLGLLVAAVGVANMTFVLVEERVPELGLRLALGAAPRQLRQRQLLETAVVVAVGGGAGLALAAGLLAALALLPMDPVAKGYLGDPNLSVPAALTIAGLLGLAAAVAGWHPAARAAAVQPVEALRHD